METLKVDPIGRYGRITTSQEILGSLVRLSIRQELDIAMARMAARTLAQSMGFSTVAQGSIMTCLSEIGYNLHLHAGGGEILLADIQTLQILGARTVARRALRLVGVDHGPGIANVAQAMIDGFSTLHSMGAGLAAMERLSDEMYLESRLKVGTWVTALYWCGTKPTRGFVR